MKAEVTTAIILETRTPKKNGTYPIKLRVTYERKQKYYSTGKSLTEDEFKMVMSFPANRKQKALRNELVGYENKAAELVKEIKPFDFIDFERKFLNKHYSSDCAFSLMDIYIAKLKDDQQLKTAGSYESASKSLQAFIGEKKLPFSKLDSKFLNRYEQWMLSKGRSHTTVGIYLRSLRTIVNLAISKKLFDRDKYPFGNNNYKVPSKANVKKALSKEDVKRIRDYSFEENIWDARHRDYWMFSFYCNGINIKDMAKLKFTDISNDTIVIIRSKTENSTKNKLKPILIPLIPEARRIIDTWGNDPATHKLVFPFLNGVVTPEDEMKAVSQTVQNINAAMARLAKKLELKVPVTTYVARHSFATILKRGGAPIEYISESLGHSNVMTTESYLGSFGSDSRDKFAKILVDL